VPAPFVEAAAVVTAVVDVGPVANADPPADCVPAPLVEAAAVVTAVIAVGPVANADPPADCVLEPIRPGQL